MDEIAIKEYHRKYSRELYRYRKEHRICVTCGVQDAFNNNVRCADCIYKASTKYDVIELAEKNKAIRDERRLLGLCIKCGEKAEDGSTRCAVCNEKNREQSRKQRQKQKKRRAEEIISKAGCYFS